jgi:LPS export ABC transporter protein LptC
VHARIYEAERREPIAEIAAGRAEGRLEGDRVRATEQVRITDRDGRALETEEAVWALDTDRVVAPGAVRLVGKNFVARGSSLAADLKSREVDVAGPIHSRVEPIKK